MVDRCRFRIFWPRDSGNSGRCNTLRNRGWETPGNWRIDVVEAQSPPTGWGVPSRRLRPSVPAACQPGTLSRRSLRFAAGSSWTGSRRAGIPPAPTGGSDGMGLRPPARYLSRIPKRRHGHPYGPFSKIYPRCRYAVPSAKDGLGLPRPSRNHGGQSPTASTAY